jgi:DNA repair protein RadD
MEAAMIWRGKALWDHQDRGVTELIEAIRSGDKRIAFTSPTGGGKTVMMGCAIDNLIQSGKRVGLYTHRRMLLDQTEGVFAKFGIPFGVRASGKDESADHTQPLQLAMIQTEAARKKRRAQYSLMDADVVFVDEAHGLANGECESILNQHVESGAVIVGVTATPSGIGHLYTKLIQAGLNSELRKCGAHVKCFVYGPDEPAAALRLRRTKTGEFTEGDVVKAIMSPTIFGRVHEHFERLNPDHKPSILFAPGVKESVWFAGEFQKRGIRAAHIDGEHIWIDGETHATSQALKDDLATESRSGRLPIVCNRFVLREGIDWPWLAHGVLATIFGGLTGYLQSVGRLVRGYPGLDHVVLQDHGGNWWRHGSPNVDRMWDLSLDDRKIAEQREEQFREKKEAEPIVCIKCGAVRMSGPVCVSCGHEASIKSRPVVQEDGTLKEMKGDIFRPRVTDNRPDTEKQWEKMYWRGRHSNMTFSQARGLFYREHHYMPPDNLPLMPKNKLDWHRKIKAVPRGEVIPKPERVEPAGLFD